MSNPQATHTNLSLTSDLEDTIERLRTRGKTTGVLTYREISEELCEREDLSPDAFEAILDGFVSIGIVLSDTMQTLATLRFLDGTTIESLERLINLSKRNGYLTHDQVLVEFPRLKKTSPHNWNHLLRFFARAGINVRDNRPTRKQCLHEDVPCMEELTTQGRKREFPSPAALTENIFRTDCENAICNAPHARPLPEKIQVLRQTPDTSEAIPTLTNQSPIRFTSTAHLIDSLLQEETDQLIARHETHSIRQYLRTIRPSQRLTEDEERHVAFRIERGKRATMDILAEPATWRMMRNLLFKDTLECTPRAQELLPLLSKLECEEELRRFSSVLDLRESNTQFASLYTTCWEHLCNEYPTTETTLPHEDLKRLDSLEEQLVQDSIAPKIKRELNKLKERLRTSSPNYFFFRLLQIESDGLRARNSLVEAHRHIPVSIARTQISNGVCILDLIQEGNLGLLRAASEFNCLRGTRFSAYAPHWVQLYISRYVANTARTIRLPKHVLESINHLTLGAECVSHEIGHTPKIERLSEWMYPTNDEDVRSQHSKTYGRDFDLHDPIIAEEIKRRRKTSVDNAKALTEVFPPPLSLDATVSIDDDPTFPSIVEHPEELAVLDTSFDYSAGEDMVDAMHFLGERERRVLKLNYGFEDDDPHTLEEVSQELGLTRERVRQIKDRTIKDLRSTERTQWFRQHWLTE